MELKNHKILQYYVSPSGKTPFKEWLGHFKDELIRARIRRRLDRLEEGHYGDRKALGEGVFELRLTFGSGYRVYFAEQDGCIVILLCGGDKSTQKRDIVQAKHYWRDLQEKC
jgi:putative addiction module killer protein